MMQHRLLYGHSAAVNCFLHPFEENTRYDPQLLLSGSADFAVIVWNISTGAKLHKFCCQGGPILKMLVPPPNSSVIFLVYWLYNDLDKSFEHNLCNSRR